MTNRLDYPVVVTDCLAVFHMVRSGLAKNRNHHDAIKECRSYFSDFHIVWTRTTNQVADVATRTDSYIGAKTFVRRAVTRLGACTPKPGCDAIAARVRTGKQD
jgi:hypothetical protein